LTVLIIIQNGMPIGLSLVSGRYKDGQVIAASKEIAKVFSRAHNGEIRCPAGAPKEIL
jgi:Asp-tRNA(Asn)/Glu-tRNA(Gln) amidotransferase A subunit family amidase